MTRISGSPMRAIVADVFPFLIGLIIALLVFTFVPDTVLWLPRMFGYVGVTQ
jgi:TRAP-type C4-dicarboxylate transport system permease large subunit